MNGLIEEPRRDKQAMPPMMVYAAAKIPRNSGLLSTKYVGDDSMMVSSIRCADAPGMWPLVSFRRSLNRLASFRAMAATSDDPKYSLAGFFELNDDAYPRADPAIPDPTHANSTSSIYKRHIGENRVGSVYMSSMTKVKSRGNGGGSLRHRAASSRWSSP